METKTQVGLIVLGIVAFCMAAIQIGDGLKEIGKGIKAIAEAWKEETRLSLHNAIDLRKRGEDE